MSHCRLLAHQCQPRGSNRTGVLLACMRAAHPLFNPALGSACVLPVFCSAVLTSAPDAMASSVMSTLLGSWLPDITTRTVSSLE